jgi:hypothetical protein
MKRKTSFLAMVSVFLAATPLMFAQDLPGPTNPVLPSDFLGPQLIAWSQLQKPLPVLQLTSQRADQQPGQSPVQPQSPAKQTLTGTIVRDGSRYILKVSNNSVYELDAQDKAKQYEGRQVKIAGTLDANGSTFHIISIELIS